MCGIVGVWEREGREADRGLLVRMCTALAHRGPDREGVFVDGPIGLGHRRLVVIDPATGDQPMTNEDGSLRLVSNSEIYNYKELRRQLEGSGHRFSTMSDTEVILHLYEEKGTSCLADLRGMFSFALWDSRRRRLFLARDRLGKKPLYYYRSGGLFVFASMPRAILLHPEVRTGIDGTALDLYLSLLYIPGPGTVFSSMRKLEPGHFLVLEQGRLDEETYWRLQYSPKFRCTAEEAQERLAEILEESVRVRLRSDVPVGVFLSGGIDSSLVAALMVKELGRSAKAFSIGVRGAGYDEVPYARMVARRLGLDHYAAWVGPADLEVLPALAGLSPEPLADPSIVPTYFLSRLARREVTVALSGDAGDETFAGYDRYVHARVAETLRRMVTLGALGRRRGAEKGSVSGLTGPAVSVPKDRWLALLRFAALPLEQGHLFQLDQMAGVDREEFYSDDLFSAAGQGQAAARYFERVFSSVPQCEHYLDRLLSVDTSSYLPWDILVKVDTGTMANSLEARSPFLDHRLVEFAARLPAHYKMKGLTRKYLLRRYGRTLLPAPIVGRRKKGFSLPISEWLRAEAGKFARQIVFDPGSSVQRLFRVSTLSRLWEEHQKGYRDHGYLLWAVVVLECWLKAHGVDAAAVVAPRD